MTNVRVIQSKQSVGRLHNVHYSASCLPSKLGLLDACMLDGLLHNICASNLNILAYIAVCHAAQKTRHEAPYQ